MAMDSAQIERAIVDEVALLKAPTDLPVMPELAGDRYTSAEYEALEQAHVWRKAWLCAGRTSEFGRAGDYRVFRKAGPPILIVRGKDDGLRAFYNSCRHRGAPVARGDSGHAGLLRCQFHSWSYNLAGDLIGVPEESGFPCLNRAERGLIPVRCETWDGWVFISLDPDAPPLIDFLGGMPDELASAQMAGLRLIDRRTYRIASNWKVTQDAFLESYHVNTIHPKTAAVVNDSQSQTIVLMEGGHSWQAVHRRQPLGAAMVEAAAKPDIAGIDEKFRTLGITYSLYPNIVTPIDPVGFPILVIWPIDRFTSEIEIYFLGPDWGEGDRPAFYEGYFAFFEMLIQEDIDNLAPMQATLMSGAFSGSLLNYVERRIYWVHQAMDDAIGRDHVPEAMRAPPVLRAG